MLFGWHKSKACCWKGDSFGALLLTLLACCPTHAVAWGGGGSGKHDRVREVQQIERRWQSAELADDALAMDHMLAEDYVSVTMQGTVNTKAQQLRRMRDRLTVLERMDLSDVRVRLSGDVAVVTGRAQIVGQCSGQSLNGRYRYTQVIQLLPGGSWAMTNFEARRVARSSVQRRAHGQAAHAS